MTDAAAELPSLGGSLAVSFLSLGVVCLVAYVALRLLSVRRSHFGGGAVRVVARTPLEPKRSLVVVDVAGRGFLLASSEAGISLVAELDPETISNVTQAAVASQAPGAWLWQRLLGKAK